MTPELRAALLESGHDPDDPAIHARLAQVDRGLALLRRRWHLLDQPTTGD